MTTVAWDGRQLAADRQMTHAGARVQGCKLVRIGGLLVAGAGDSAGVREMHEWVRGGRKKDELPAFQRDRHDCVELLVVERGVCYLYQASHVPVTILQRFFAIGSGSDYATAAMHLGKTAAEAVELASLYDTSTGCGVDVMTEDGT